MRSIFKDDQPRPGAHGAPAAPPGRTVRYSARLGASEVDDVIWVRQQVQPVTLREG